MSQRESMPSVPVSPPRLLRDARSAPSRLGVDPGIWNWHRDHHFSAPPHANYYEASLTPWPYFSALAGDHSCDVVVVGGGLLGASTALHLAQAGLDVILVEKDNLGSAASGRNGGQITPGLARWGAGAMLDSLSPDEAKRLWRFASAEAMDLIDQIRADNGFRCERKYGHLTAAMHPGHLYALTQNARARRVLGDRSVAILSPEALKNHVSSDIYHGGALDGRGGQLHPLALLRGIIYGFTKLGGRVHEQTEVTEVRESPGDTTVVTTSGNIKARNAVILAVHNFSHRFIHGHPTTMPFFTYVGVTPPLQTKISELLPSDIAIYDTQLQIDYYRHVRHNRLLFGGEGTGSCLSPEDTNAYLLHRIKTVFPQLTEATLEYSWSGSSDCTLNGATDCRKSDAAVPVYMVHGWSGHGVAQTVRIGKAISDDVTGRNTDFAMLTRIDHTTLPLGRFLAPVAIPLIKGAVSVFNHLHPTEMVSF
ncbi:MAG: NAD(P)/FAD-dependent oxidoreductase [Janthinobacterium lividum]